MEINIRMAIWYNIWTFRGQAQRSFRDLMKKTFRVCLWKLLQWETLYTVKKSEGIEENVLVIQFIVPKFRRLNIANTKLSHCWSKSTTRTIAFPCSTSHNTVGQNWEGFHGEISSSQGVAVTLSINCRVTKAQLSASLDCQLLTICNLRIEPLCAKCQRDYTAVIGSGQRN